VPLRFASAFALAFLSLFSFACAGSEEKFPEIVTLRQEDVQPLINNSEIVVGQNRLVIGLLGPDSRLIVDARVHLTFYELTGDQATKRFEADAVSRVPARDAQLAEEVVHTHTDGSRHVHLAVGDDIGFYTANVEFDKAGDWGVEIAVESANPRLRATLRPRFNVVTEGPTPAIGEPAPRSRNLIAADVADISQIDSSARPSTEMHTSTIADAIAAGRPTLVLFAVPGFCESRLCGPELEIMRKLYPQYRGRAEFIHVEFYENPGSPSRVVVQAAQEWNLRSEPWFFVIDGQGIVRAKFEGPASLQELDEALKQVTSTSAR
jgi:hypothetical protein